MQGRSFQAEPGGSAGGPTDEAARFLQRAKNRAPFGVAHRGPSEGRPSRLARKWTSSAVIFNSLVRKR